MVIPKIEGTASHRIPYSSETRVPSSFLYFSRTQLFCVAMISRTEYRTTVVQALDQRIDIEYVAFFSKFCLACSVREIIASEHDDFQRSFPLLYFEIIITKTKKRVRRHFIDSCMKQLLIQLIEKGDSSR